MTATLTRYDAHALIHALQDNGGFTVDPITGEEAPRTGYAVSLPDCEVTYPAVSITAEDIASHALDVRIAAHTTDTLHHVWQGGWRDDESALVYLDASIIAQSEDDARYLARHWGQLAYFDLANGQTVRVDTLAGV